MAPEPRASSCAARIVGGEHPRGAPLLPRNSPRETIGSGFVSIADLARPDATSLRIERARLEHARAIIVDSSFVSFDQSRSRSQMRSTAPSSAVSIAVHGDPRSIARRSISSPASPLLRALVTARRVSPRGDSSRYCSIHRLEANAAARGERTPFSLPPIDTSAIPVDNEGAWIT